MMPLERAFRLWYIQTNTNSIVRYHPLHRRELTLAPHEWCHHKVLQETKRPIFDRFPYFHIKWNDDDGKEAYCSPLPYELLLHTTDLVFSTGTYNQSSKTEVIKTNVSQIQKDSNRDLKPLNEKGAFQKKK